jgi:hypothetical protein
MRLRTLLLVALSAVAMVVGPTLAYAQDAAIADIPMKFIAGGVTHDPGRFELRPDDGGAGVTLTSPKGRGQEVLVMTRLAMAEPPNSECRLVFDKVGDTYYLSELWIPGADGYLLHAVKGPHTHHVMKASGKAK